MRTVQLVQPPELPVELGVVRQLAVRRRLVDHVRQHLRDGLGRLVLADAELLRDLRQLLLVERRLDVVGVGRLVRPGRDPRLPLRAFRSAGAGRGSSAGRRSSACSRRAAAASAASDCRRGRSSSHRPRRRRGCRRAGRRARRRRRLRPRPSRDRRDRPCRAPFVASDLHPRLSRVDPLRVAVVGSGPAGFYAASALLASDLPVEVDLIERLPTPWGLVRLGVAPDHPNIKAVSRAFEKTAAQPGFRFFGNVEVGKHVTHEELRGLYDAVVYSVGAQTDRQLGIPGEDLPGSWAATEFVAWYNGHPDFQELEFDLSHERAVVIGNGNVALDVARMLALTPEELAPTDTTDAAIEAINDSGDRGDPRRRPARAGSGRVDAGRGRRARRARGRRHRRRPGRSRAGRGERRRARGRAADRQAQRRPPPRLRRPRTRRASRAGSGSASSPRPSRSSATARSRRSSSSATSSSTAAQSRPE